MREVLSYSLILSVPVPGCRQVLSTYLGQHSQNLVSAFFYSPSYLLLPIAFVRHRWKDRKFLAFPTGKDYTGFAQ